MNIPQSLQTSLRDCKKLTYYAETAQFEQGQFGVICKGVYLRERVVIKVANAHTYHHQACRHIHNEIMALSRLEHPHLIRLLAVFPFQDNYGMVLEQMDGNLNDLYSYAEQSGHHMNVTMLTGLHLSNALCYLKDQNIVHGDIHPANLLFNWKGKSAVIKLCDMGISVYGGTPAYKEWGMFYQAPEISHFWTKPGWAVSERVFTPASDIWSTGSLLLELLIAPLDDDYLINTITKTGAHSLRPETTFYSLLAKPDSIVHWLHSLLCKKDMQQRYPFAGRFRAYPEQVLSLLEIIWRCLQVRDDARVEVRELHKYFGALSARFK